MVIQKTCVFRTGAERLIRHLHATNVPFALATSSSQEMALLKMTNHVELFSLFHHKVYGTTDPEVILGKPAPDIFLVAAKRFPDQPDSSKVRIGIFTNLLKSKLTIIWLLSPVSRL